MAPYTGVSAAIWSFFEKLSSQAVSFVIGIVLARLLTPYDYGVVGLTAFLLQYQMCLSKQALRMH